MVDKVFIAFLIPVVVSSIVYFLIDDANHCAGASALDPEEKN